MTCRKLPEGAELSEWQKAHEAAGNPVLGEDRMIVEAQTGAIRTDGSEVSVPTDDPPSRFVGGIGRRCSTRLETSPRSSLSQEDQAVQAVPVAAQLAHLRQSH